MHKTGPAIWASLKERKQKKQILDRDAKPAFEGLKVEPRETHLSKLPLTKGIADNTRK